MKNYCVRTGAQKVMQGFSYNSGSNRHFLSVDELRDLVADYLASEQ